MTINQFMKRSWSWLFSGVSLLAVLFGTPVQTPPPAAEEETVFSRDVEPIFQKHCYQCHGSEIAMNGYSLWRRVDAIRGGYSGVPAIKPGDSAGSRLVRLVAGLDDELIMPPAGPRLSEHEISLLRAWIDQGVKWDADRSISRPAFQEWLEMDYGPTISTSISVGKPKDPRADRDEGQNLSYKAHAVFLKEDRGAGIVFDTELLRYAAGWTQADLVLTGTVFDWKHGPYPYLDGPPVFETEVGPGWAYEGSFDDPRKEKLGNLPKDQAKYRGYYRHREKVIFSYEVSGTKILDFPEVERWGNLDVIARTVELGPAKGALKLSVARLNGEAEYLELLFSAPINHRLMTARTAVKAGSLILGFVGNGEARWNLAEDRIELEFPPSDSDRVGRLFFTRTESTAPFVSQIQKTPLPNSLKPLTRGSEPLYPETILTSGELGKNNGPFAVDKITLPFDNPWSSWMRPGDFSFFEKEDRAALTTWSGDVWIASGIDADLDRIAWKRFATGFHQPLGIEVVDGQVYVLDRNQITRLHDQNGDGEADFYENFNNDILATQHFHEFTFDLDRDREGNFYFAKAARAGLPASTEHHGVIVKVDPTGHDLKVVCRGFRVPNGVAVGFNGEITTSDQQGQWVPATPVIWCRPDGYYGYAWGGGVRPEEADSHERPIMYLPINFDNSGGGQAWVPDNRWGPFRGQLIHTSYGRGKIFLVLIEEVHGVVQGGAVEFPLDFDTGLMRPDFRKKDGQLYITGLRGWSTSKKEIGGFYRVRYTGGPVLMPAELHVSRDKGVTISFSRPIDRSTAEDLQSYQVRRWQYERSERYGSDMYQLDGKPGTEPVNIRSVRLSSDDRSISLDLDDLREVDQMYIKMLVRDVEGESLSFEVFHTINILPESQGTEVLSLEK